MVLRERLSKWLKQQHLEPQYGFIPGRGCADALLSLRSLCSLAWNKNKTSYIGMLDLAKAFDSADRDLAWRILLTRGAPPKLVALLEDLHTDHCGIVRAELDSADVHIDKGVKQGCANSPGLFSIYQDTVVRQLQPFLQQAGVGIQYRINGDFKQVLKPTSEQLMWIIMYADDIAFISGDVASLKAAIGLLDTVFSDWGLTVSTG